MFEGTEELPMLLFLVKAMLIPFLFYAVSINSPLLFFSSSNL